MFSSSRAFLLLNSCTMPITALTITTTRKFKFRMEDRTATRQTARITKMALK